MQHGVSDAALSMPWDGKRHSNLLGTRKESVTTSALGCFSGVRFVAKITAELTKESPCKGVLSRELLELELRALTLDRESIENKLGLLLSSFAGSQPWQ